MLTKDKIEVIEKPNSISWDQIKDCLVSSHSVNVEKGIRMRYPTLPSDDIRKKIEQGKGKMFVALVDGKMAGVAGYQIKKSHSWFHKGEYLYLCFAGVLPEYSGLGIYKQLYIYREREREQLQLPLLMFDTHERNLRIIKINQHNGFTKVDFKRYGDHYNVVMAKWEGVCPYSKWYIRYRYLLKKYKLKLKYLITK